LECSGLVGGADGFGLRATLGEIAENIGSEERTEFWHVVVEGWDSHYDQRRTYDRLAPKVAAALADFGARLEQRDLGHRVLVVLWSEFGRQPMANAQGGTDDALAAPVLLLGPRMGAAQALTETALAEPGVADLRSVYAGVLHHWLHCRNALDLLHASASHSFLPPLFDSLA
jgi:uncharacterized protein (DUF1501 family)